MIKRSLDASTRRCRKRPRIGAMFLEPLVNSMCGERTLEKFGTGDLVNEQCNNTAQPVPETQLLTYGEVADRMRVSVRSVRRLVEDGELIAVYIRRSPRIRELDLAKYLNLLANSCYNQQCVGLDVRHSSRGQRTCQDATTKTASTNGRTRKSTGRATSTDAAKELADLLGLPTAGKRTRS